MDLLSAFSACGLFVTAACATPTIPPSRHQTVVARLDQWQPLIAQAAASFALPEAWVRAVISNESGGRITLGGQPITSSAGAMGLMQLMPKTYADMRRQYALGPDAYAPSNNIWAGTAYLRQMYQRYGYPGMFAAYNAGPGRFDDFLLRQRPLPHETITYVAGIAPGAETAFFSGAVARKPTVERSVASPIDRKPDTIFFRTSAGNSLFVALAAPHY